MRSLALGRWSIASFAALAGVTMATWLLAVGLTQIVGGACLPLHEGALVFRTEVASATPAPAPSGRIRATTIVTNDPFDSTAHAATASTSTAPTLGAAPCPGGYRLVASAVDDAAPQRSIAILESAASGSALDAPMVHVGSSLGSSEVVAVGASRVWLRSAGGACFIGTTPSSVAAPIASSVAPTPAAPTPLGIARIDDAHVAVDRAVRDALLESPQDLMRALLVAPETSGGKTIGLRLVRVKPGSLLAALGLRAGDVVRSLNGFEVGSAEKMLEAMAVLKTAPSLDVAFVRDGAPKTLSIEIR